MVISFLLAKIGFCFSNFSTFSHLNRKSKKKKKKVYDLDKQNRFGLMATTVHITKIIEMRVGLKNFFFLLVYFPMSFLLLLTTNSYIIRRGKSWWVVAPTWPIQTTENIPELRLRRHWSHILLRVLITFVLQVLLMDVIRTDADNIH